MTPESLIAATDPGTFADPAPIFRPSARRAAAAPTAARPDRVVRDVRPRGRVVAVASGKGGVGKTNVAVNVAIGLAGAGQRVLLVDADVGLANVDLVLGRRPRAHLGHVLAGHADLESVVQDGPAGIRWVPGASHPANLAAAAEPLRDALADGLAALERAHDLVMLDLPAGIGPGVLPQVRHADEILLVTTPEPPAVMDAYSLLKAAATGADEPLGPVGLVVNIVSHRRDAHRVHERLVAAARRFLNVEIDFLGYVFCDGHVGRAVQKQQPVTLAYPHSQAAWCMKRVAGALLEGSQRPRRGPRPAFLRRLANLFGGFAR
ncbi:MAG: MinD/ParA family protein [Phycisphaerae bacterium]